MSGENVDVSELVAQFEIASRLGISRERVRQLSQRDGFPTPVAKVGRSLVWRWADVKAWDDQRRVAPRAGRASRASA